MIYIQFWWLILPIPAVLECSKGCDGWICKCTNDIKVGPSGKVGLGLKMLVGQKKFLKTKGGPIWLKILHQ